MALYSAISPTHKKSYCGVAHTIFSDLRKRTNPRLPKRLIYGGSLVLAIEDGPAKAFAANDLAVPQLPPSSHGEGIVFLLLE
jgi:hypothetical protein